MGALVFKEGFHFVHEVIKVSELPVHRGEPHIRDLIRLLEGRHHFLSDPRAGYFLDTQSGELLSMESATRSRTSMLMGRSHTPFSGRGVSWPIKGLPPAVLFHHHGMTSSTRFIGGESLPALQALASPAYGFSFLARAGIHDPVFQIAAERTLHQ